MLSLQSFAAEMKIKTQSICMMKMKPTLFFSLVCSILAATSVAQLPVNVLDQHLTVDFNTTQPGVNEGPFQGGGIASIPAPGQLNSKAWEVVLQEGTTELPFGSNSNIPELNLGLPGKPQNLSHSQPGIFALDRGNSDYAMGINPGNKGFDLGWIVLAIVNNSGSFVDTVELGCDLLYADREKNNSITVEFGYSKFNFSSTAVMDSFDVHTLETHTTPGGKVNSTAWTAFNTQAHSIPGINLPDGDTLFLRWKIVPSKNKNDQVAIDNIRVSMGSSPIVFDAGWSVDPSGLAGPSDTLLVRSGAAAISRTTTASYVQVAAGASLELTDSLKVEDGLYLVAGGNQDYAQVIGPVAGTTTWETYLSSDKPARWFNIGIPLHASIDDIQFTNGAFLQTLEDVANDTAQVNIWWYDPDLRDPYTNEGSWRPVQSRSTLTDTAAFSIYMGAPYFGSLPAKMSVRGSLVDGTTAHKLSASNGGWNFMANPYPSVLDWNQVFADNPGAVNATYYVLNDESNSQWKAYNAVAGEVPGMAGMSEHLAPGQAVFVKSLVTGSPVNFSNGQRSLLRNPSLESSLPRAGIFLNLTTADSISAFTYLGLDAAATDLEDVAIDGIKKMNAGGNAMNFYSSLYGANYTYNFVNKHFATRAIPLKLDLAKAAAYSIKADIRGIDPAWTVELEDAQHQRYDLRSGEFTFSSPAGLTEFTLHISQNLGVKHLDAAETEIFAYRTEDAWVVKHNLQQQNGHYHIRLYSAQGKLIKDLNTGNASETMLSANGLTAGVYVLQVLKDGRQVYSQKLLW